VRLLRRADYEAVYGAGQRRSSPQFAVFFRAQQKLQREPSIRAPAASHAIAGAPVNETHGPSPVSRFGISVKKTVGGAVVRNRIRRRIREILRRNRMEIPSGWDIVIHPRSSVARAPFAPLEAELVSLLRGIAQKV
jgi:ribonuclease P protein component